jgi:hypothetical protein
MATEVNQFRSQETRMGRSDSDSWVHGFRIQITLNPAQSSDAALAAAFREYLEARGYAVHEPRGLWENPATIGARLDVHPFTITRRLHRWEKMGRTLPVRSGASGRLIELQSNKEFDAFVTANTALNNSEAMNP